MSGTFKTERDETTGLPRLPEGYFWRVDEDSLGLPRVRLMRLRKRWFPKQEGEYLLPWARRRIININEFPDHPEAGKFDPENPRDVITLSAYFLLSELEDELRRRQRNKELGDLYGDYPPKTLNKSSE